MGVKSISWVFVKQLIILAAEVILALGLFVALFLLGTSTGAILPANYASLVLEKNSSAIVNGEGVDLTLLPKYSHYILFDLSGNMLETSMDARELEIYNERVAGNYISNKSLMRIYEREHDKLVVSYDMRAKYGNEALEKVMPPVEVSFIVLYLLSFVGLIVLRAQKIKKELNRALKPLIDDIENINGEDIHDILFSESKEQVSNISEIARVQETFDNMKRALSEALKKEWEGEAKQKENMRALAHDIKTPLTVIRGNAELLEEDENGEDKLCDSIIRNCDRIEGYVALLMEQGVKSKVDKIESGKFNEKVKKSIYDVCRAEKIKVLIEEEGIREVSLALDIERTCRGIMNLVTNAINYTDKEKGIRVRVIMAEGTLSYEIMDFGPGFSSEALKRCTDEFFTEDQARSGKHFGLGMHFAKNVAIECGGNLKVENTSDGGMVTFTIAY